MKFFSLQTFASTLFLGLSVSAIEPINICNDELCWKNKCERPEDDCCLKMTSDDIEEPGVQRLHYHREEMRPIIPDRQPVNPDIKWNRFLFDIDFKAKENKVIVRRPPFIGNTSFHASDSEPSTYTLHIDCDTTNSFQCFSFPSRASDIDNAEVVDTIAIHPGNWCNKKGKMWYAPDRYDNLWIKYNGHFRNVPAHKKCRVRERKTGRYYLFGKIEKGGAFCSFDNVDEGYPLTSGLMEDGSVYEGTLGPHKGK